MAEPNVELSGEDVSRYSQDPSRILFGRSDRPSNGFLSSSSNLTSAFDTSTGQGSFHIMLTELVPNAQINPAKVAATSDSSKRKIPSSCGAYLTLDDGMNAAQASAKKQRKTSNVRKTGACVRCQLNNCECSEFRVCERCIKAKAYANQTKCLRWMDCFKLDLMAFNVFARESTDPEYPDLDLTMLVDENNFRPNALRPSRNIKTICEELGRRMLDSPDCTCSTITSLFPDMFDEVGRELGRQFSSYYRFVVDPYAAQASLLESGSSRFALLDSPLAPSMSNLNHAIAIGGSRVLQQLEVLLKAKNIKAHSKEKGRALFLALIGIILGTGHSQRIQFTSPEPHIYDTMMDHLTRALAHYVIYLGIKLSLIDDKSPLEDIFVTAKALSQQRNKFFLCAFRFPEGTRTQPPVGMLARRQGCVLDGLSRIGTSDLGIPTTHTGHSPSSRDQILPIHLRILESHFRTIMQVGVDSLVK